MDNTEEVKKPRISARKIRSSVPAKAERVVLFPGGAGRGVVVAVALAETAVLWGT